MTLRGRLVPILDNGNHVIGFITFYIGDNDTNKYVRDDMWSVVEDEPLNGTICYVDHLITNKDKLNAKKALFVFEVFKQMIKDRFPQVRTIRWNRYKNGGAHVYYKSIK